MEKKLRIILLIGFLIITISCNQSPEEEQPLDVTRENSEFVITQEEVNGEKIASALIVRLSIVRLDAYNRYGRASFFWTDRSGSTLSGTASVRLRKAGSTATLAESIDVPINSNVDLYTNPYYTEHIAQTPLTTIKRAICIEVTGWNLTADSDYSFDNQAFPLTLCVKNSIETDADMAVVLDPNSKTDTIAVAEEFPFVIGVQSLGPKAASGVMVNVLLPDNINFVKDRSSKYICSKSSTDPQLLRCLANGDVLTGHIGLPIILQGTSKGNNNIAVSVDTISTDPNYANNNFNQIVSIENAEMACKVVTIPDLVLETAIRKQLNIPSGPICEADMLLLTTLSEPNGGISSFEGLQYATNLSSLSLPRKYTQYVSLTPLTGLTKLTHLDLSQTLIPDLTPLAGLVSLKELELYNTNINDLTPLAELTSLEALNLQQNYISNITALVSNTGLGAGDTVNLGNNCLDLSSDFITDIHILEGRGVAIDYEQQGVSCLN